MDQCPTWIQSKISKNPPIHGNTRVVTKPYQGLLIDFYFYGTTYDESDQKNIYEGINSETCCILITDNFTRINHGYARISKASPISWIRHLLNQYSPTCDDKCIHLDQGGKIFNKPDVKNLLQSFGYTILYPTGADISHQNGPLEQAHRTLAKYIKSMISGAKFEIKNFPYELYHDIWLSNFFPEPNTITSLIDKDKSNQ